MDAPLTVRTRVLPGHRLEIVDDGLPDGGEVEVTVTVVASVGGAEMPGNGPGLRARTLRELVGTWTGVEARGLDNEQLDAELLAEYENTHEDAA